jgi:hypothetical protein
VLGIISLVALAVAIIARYVCHMAGAWRPIYVVCAVLALYLGIFGVKNFRVEPPL